MGSMAALSIELRRYKYAARLGLGKFRNNEAVHAVFKQYCKPGDCVVDIGANVGHYTKDMSDQVGPTGRVLAFEPIPESLALLSMNVLNFQYKNVTCLGLALDLQAGERRMSIPVERAGKQNLYLSAFTHDDSADLCVRAIDFDSLGLGIVPQLINVCAEGAELAVLQGMSKCLQAHRPILVVENKTAQIRDWLVARGYAVTIIDDSPSVLAIAGDATA